MKQILQNSLNIGMKINVNQEIQKLIELVFCENDKIFY